MESPDTTPQVHTPDRALSLTLAFSLVVHLLVLFAIKTAPPPASPAASRLQASLAPRAVPAPRPKPPKLEAKPQASSKPKRRPPILALQKPQGPLQAADTPRWTIAQKTEMDNFLRELDNQPRPTLAQRATAMARADAVGQARAEASGQDVLERLPDSPPVDPFSLEMYLDSLVRKLNRSAGFVQSDPRARGVKTAQVRVRLNPDGSLLDFQVVRAADQFTEIAYIRSVVERAIPFAPFPVDLRRSARSLTMMICILPPSLSGGIGFTRNPDGGRC